MGNGRRNGNVLNFQITAKYEMQPNDYFLWKRAFFKASELLYNATEGQIRFGKIYVTNDNEGADNAEYMLDADPSGRSSVNTGGFGTPGRNVNLLAYAQTQVLSIIHELGHLVWGLKEEYTRRFYLDMDIVGALPTGHGNAVILLIDDEAERPDADFAGAKAILTFGGTAEQKDIVSKVGNTITVDSAFSANPQTADDDRVKVEFDASCTDDVTTGACIMEFSRNYAGEFDISGNWVPAANPVTEFCTAENHDPDEDTDQHHFHMKSCWDVIVEHEDFNDLTKPADGTEADKVMPGGYTDPEWIVLEDSPRFALILDKSGSMNNNGGTRLEGVKTGASYWVENAAVEGDFLTILWYNHSQNTILPLTDFTTLTEAEITDLTDNAIGGETAIGSTNIRDALMEGLTELISPTDLAVYKCALLLTDGAHNTPLFTSELEVIPDFQENNTNIYTLGIGNGSDMNLDNLDALSTETGGSAFVSGDGSDDFDVQNNIIEINNIIRGGVIANTDDIELDSDAAFDRLIDSLQLQPDLPFEKRPPLSYLVEQLGFDSLTQLSQQIKGGFKQFYFTIEPNTSSTTFTLSFQKNAQLWMYLFDPEGIEVKIDYPNLKKFVSSGTYPYEFAKIEKPKAGKWIMVAFNAKSGVSSKVKAIAGIQNPNLNVYGKAEVLSHKCGIVNLSANARYYDAIKGYKVKAIFKNAEGKRYEHLLYDEESEGIFERLLMLPPGHYSGYIKFYSKGNSAFADIDHATSKMHMNGDKFPNLIVKHPPFKRSVPISFFIKPSKKVRINKNELRWIKGKGIDRFVPDKLRNQLGKKTK